MTHMIHLHRENAVGLFEQGKVAARIEEDFPNVKVTGAVGYVGTTPTDCDIFITGDNAAEVRSVADWWLSNQSHWTGGYAEVS